MRNTTFLFGAAALLATATGCGGGGDSGGSTPATELAFTVAWEQRVAAAASGETASPGGAALGFDTPIPPSVSAIRFILRPESGGECCVAVIRGSQAFTDRHIVLADVPEGQSTLEVHGFPTDFAPAGGVTAECATRGGGVPCSSSETMPSFGSDETDVDVVRGQRNVVNVDVYSLPFLLDLDPGDGETADSARPRIEFTVVDANHNIDPDLGVRLRREAVTVNADILSTEPCRDDDAELPDCSEGAELEVSGLHVTARSPQELQPGTAELRIQATNTGSPPRDMESNTTFVVPGDGTTSTTTTTTSSSSTTSTTGDTTTTTLGDMETFCLRFSVGNEVDLIGISYTVSYASTGGDFVGSAENVSCTSVVDVNPEATVLATFNDADSSDTLSTAIIASDTFTGPTPLAECTFNQVPPLVPGDLDIQVTEATAPDFSSADATVVVEETECP